MNILINLYNQLFYVVKKFIKLKFHGFFKRNFFEMYNRSDPSSYKLTGTGDNQLIDSLFFRVCLLKTKKFVKKKCLFCFISYRKLFVCLLTRYQMSKMNKKLLYITYNLTIFLYSIYFRVVEDEVRAPIPQTRGILVDEPYSSM